MEEVDWFSYLEFTYACVRTDFQSQGTQYSAKNGGTGMHTCRNWDKLREWQTTRIDVAGEHEHEHDDHGA